MDYRDNACATFANMLTTLDQLAAKAQDAGLGDEVLAAKLADDMFPLETQFRIAVNQVILGLIRVTNAEIPLDETAYATLAQVRERLGAIRARVDEAAKADWLAPDAQVDFTLPNAMRFVMSAEEYIRDWTMPNFYFHTTMAYALLRREGLAIGKIDFLPHMARYAAAPAG
jgi:hypothetical protein